MCAQHRLWRDCNARHDDTSVRKGREVGLFPWIGLVMARKRDVTLGSKTCICQTYLKLALLDIQWQIRYHDLGLSGEGCSWRCGCSLGLLVLSSVLGDTADWCSGSGRAARVGLATTAATATGRVLAGLEDLVQAELHLIGHGDEFGGDETCWCWMRGESGQESSGQSVSSGGFCFFDEGATGRVGRDEDKGALDGAERVAA